MLSRAINIAWESIQRYLLLCEIDSKLCFDSIKVEFSVILIIVACLGNKDLHETTVFVILVPVNQLLSMSLLTADGVTILDISRERRFDSTPVLTFH